MSPRCARWCDTSLIILEVFFFFWGPFFVFEKRGAHATAVSGLIVSF